MSHQIPLSQGRSALVDDADYDQLLRFRWHITRNGYAAGRVEVNGMRERIYMHRFLLNAQPGDLVDHLDGNRLNNTRCQSAHCHPRPESVESSPAGECLWLQGRVVAPGEKQILCAYPGE